MYTSVRICQCVETSRLMTYYLQVSLWNLFLVWNRMETVCSQRDLLRPRVVRRREWSEQSSNEEQWSHTTSLQVYLKIPMISEFPWWWGSGRDGPIHLRIVISKYIQHYVLVAADSFKVGDLNRCKFFCVDRRIEYLHTNIRDHEMVCILCTFCVTG